MIVIWQSVFYIND